MRHLRPARKFGNQETVYEGNAIRIDVDGGAHLRCGAGGERERH